ncbi:structural protein [Vibrio phage R01]|nr:structural protein [Vibrio phage R01]
MNDVDARKVVNKALKDGWTEHASTVDISYEGDEYKPSPNKAYIEVNFSVESTPSQSMGDEGNRTFIREGAVHVNVYVPKNNGNAFAAHIYALAVRDIFEGKHFGELWFWECKASPAGSDGNYNVAYANCAFRFQEIK